MTHYLEGAKTLQISLCTIDNSPFLNPHGVVLIPSFKILKLKWSQATIMWIVTVRMSSTTCDKTFSFTIHAAWPKLSKFALCVDCKLFQRRYLARHSFEQTVLTFINNNNACSIAIPLAWPWVLIDGRAVNKTFWSIWLLLDQPNHPFSVWLKLLWSQGWSEMVNEPSPKSLWLPILCLVMSSLPSSRWSSRLVDHYVASCCKRRRNGPPKGAESQSRLQNITNEPKRI